MHTHKTETLYCTICRTVIGDERIAKQSVTCSKACANQLRNIRRKKRDLKKCRFCNQPSTPEERAQFKEWRRAQGTLRERGRPKNPPKPEVSSPQAEFTDMMHVP